MQQRLKEEIQLKNEKIKELERQQQKDKVMKERAESTMRQMDEVKELQKNIIMDRDIIF